MKRTPLLRKTPFKRKKPQSGVRLTSKQKRHVTEVIRYGRKLWSMKKADQEFSKFIRERDGNCQRCGTTENLTCSHFWGRSHKATRYDPNNCVAVCWMPCHKYHWEKEKQGDYRDFMISWLGEEEYAALERRARSSYPLVDAIRDVMVLLGKI